MEMRIVTSDEWAEHCSAYPGGEYCRENGPNVLECVSKTTLRVIGRVEYHEDGTRTYYISD